MADQNKRLEPKTINDSVSTIQLFKTGNTGNHNFYCEYSALTHKEGYVQKQGLKTSTNCICIARSVLESVEETCFREACCGVRSGGVFLEESVRVVEGKETGLRRVCY